MAQPTYRAEGRVGAKWILSSDRYWAYGGQFGRRRCPESDLKLVVESPKNSVALRAVCREGKLHRSREYPRLENRMWPVGGLPSHRSAFERQRNCAYFSSASGVGESLGDRGW